MQSNNQVVTSSTEAYPEAIHFTDAASHKVAELIKEENNFNLKLRDDKDEAGNSSEVVVKLLVDPMSFQYLAGAEIDYKEDLNGAQFVIRNPNAKTTCGCGSSFSM